MDSIIAENGLEATYAHIDDVIVCGQSREDHDRKLQRFKEVESKHNLKYFFGQHELTCLGYSISNGSLRPDPDRIKPLMDLPIPKDLSSLKRVLVFFPYELIWIYNYFKRIQPIQGGGGTVVYRSDMRA